MTSLTKSCLTPARRRLLELMQELNFGTIEGLEVRGGEPAVGSARVVRQVRFGGDNRPRPERQVRDFSLKAEHRELFLEFDRLGSGTIAVIEVLHGLPRKMSVEHAGRN